MFLRRAAIVAVISLLAACGRAADPALALAESANAVARDGAGTIDVPAETAGYRNSAGADVPLPDGFPSDIVLPEKYAVVSVTTMGASQSVVLRSDEAMATLFGRFRADQAAGGWSETVSMQGMEGAMLGLQKDSRGMVVNFRQDMAGHTVLSLSLQPQVLANR
jgi:hypothetical protein